MKIIPIKRTTLADEVVEQIKRMIVDGEVKRGEKLPAERELAERFSVGRPTIREALKALVALGILTRKREIDVIFRRLTFSPVRKIFVSRKG